SSCEELRENTKLESCGETELSTSSKEAKKKYRQQIRKEYSGKPLDHSKRRDRRWKGPPAAGHSEEKALDLLRKGGFVAVSNCAKCHDGELHGPVPSTTVGTEGQLYFRCSSCRSWTNSLQCASWLPAGSRFRKLTASKLLAIIVMYLSSERPTRGAAQAGTAMQD
ncbi:unnamed protein product, partial [Effrenium voratum]